MVGGAAGLLGGPGNEFVSGFLKRLARHKGSADGETLEPSEVRAELERELRERLQAQGEEQPRCGGRSAGCWRRLAASRPRWRLPRTRSRVPSLKGFAELSGEWEEFRWMLAQVEQGLHEIQQRQAEGARES